MSPGESWCELECLFDDLDEPSKVTIFYPRGERTVSEWMTADVEAARSLDEIA
ncbi:MAG: hypothetical protein ABEH64_09500 [Salinirussus sp.]